MDHATGQSRAAHQATVSAVQATAPRCRSIPALWDAPTSGAGIMVEMAFHGWPVEAVEFYEGLEADNTKTYWQEHKSVYERCVKAPMDELLAELAEDLLAPAAPGSTTSASAATRRRTS